MLEDFQPISNSAPVSLSGKIKFYGRMLLDLQIFTIYTDLKRVVASLEGDVLDVGCGDSPYRHMMNPTRTTYQGLDIVERTNFNYANSDLIAFDGETIPFGDDSFDAVICTEVLEHVLKYQVLVDEMHRVARAGALILVTVPWSARFHYIPFDYFRYTPSALAFIFSKFRSVKISPRGSDISTIAAKIFVLWFRNLIPRVWWRWLWFPVSALTTPLVILLIAMAHFSLLLGLGSKDDPLGYTLIAEK